MPDRTVVITGASSGFGRGVALRLAAQGWNLVLAARRDDPLEQLAAECGNAVSVGTDVGNARDVQKLAEVAIATFNGFDVLITCIARSRSAPACTAASWSGSMSNDSPRGIEQ